MAAYRMVVLVPVATDFLCAGDQKQVAAMAENLLTSYKSTISSIDKQKEYKPIMLECARTAE